jgi:hypothetical protein
LLDLAVAGEDHPRAPASRKNRYFQGSLGFNAVDETALQVESFLLAN